MEVSGRGLSSDSIYLHTRKDFSHTSFAIQEIKVLKMTIYKKSGFRDNNKP